MRSSVIVISSANASINSIGRNMLFDRSGPERCISSTTTVRGTRPVKGRRRVGKAMGYEEFTRPTHSKMIDQENDPEQLPIPGFLFPRGFASDVSVPSSLDDTPSLGCSADTTNVVPPLGRIFMRCLTFLKGVGVRLTLPPYTIYDEPSHVVARNRGYINWSAAVTNFPVV